MNNSIKVSVVIPNYNGIDLLPSCLDSVEAQTYSNLEIIVVDDASTDESIELLKKRKVKLIVNRTNRGFAATVNEGIKEASGEYVLLLNNDVVLTSNFLEALVLNIERDENIFSVSSKMLRYYERDTIDDTGDEYTVFGWVYKRGDGDPANFYPYRDQVFSACAGAGLYRRKLIGELGYFDSVHESYLEDVDLGWRARINGYVNTYEPNALCYHIGSATLAGGNRYSDKKVYLSARNNVYIIYKNMPTWQIVLNFPALLLGFSIKYLYFLNLGFGKDYKAGVREALERMRTVCTKAKSGKLINYLKIQNRMITSTFSYSFKKIEKLVVKTTKTIGNFLKRKVIET